ncbi:MAG: HAD family hydrolase [Myxococcales bacterium]|nr:HAD family hydrolase [Myxococcales bacterium]
MQLILLFDIDGTLLDCAGAGRRSMISAFGAAYGRPDACDGFVFGGMTDRAIARQGLEAIGQDASPRAIDALIDGYRGFLAVELAKSEKLRVHDGALSLVELARSQGHAVGLGTGNVRAGARLKLEHAGIWDRFDFGGFGCDAEARPELLSIGRGRGRERLGTSETATWVIGDTPRDVEAAHAIGADCLAVTTGRFDAQALRAAGARHVVDSLADALARDIVVKGISS